jgi:hypothetical protein
MFADMQIKMLDYTAVLSKRAQKQSEKLSANFVAP